jgi:hypothetical protein
MTRRVLFVAVLALALAPLRGLAQETYSLKHKEAGQDDSYLLKHTENMKWFSRVIDNQGNSKREQIDTKGKTIIFVETVLQKAPGQGHATSLRRVYQKAELIGNDQTRTLPLEGKTVLIHKKDNAYQYRQEDGAALPAEQAGELDYDFNRRIFNFLDQDIMPSRAVQLNESWMLDPAVVLQGMGKDELKKYDLANVKLAAKLVRVYSQNKSQFGVVEFHFELPLTAGLEAAKGFKVVGGKLVIQGTFDGCIDGSTFNRTTKANVTSVIRGYQKDNLTPLLVVLEGSGTLEEVREDISKK